MPDCRAIAFAPSVSAANVWSIAAVVSSAIADITRLYVCFAMPLRFAAASLVFMLVFIFQVFLIFPVPPDRWHLFRGAALSPLFCYTNVLLFLQTAKKYFIILCLF